MCFIRNGNRYITSRSYVALFSNRYCILKSSKKYDQELVIDIVNKSGDISFEIVDLKNNKAEVLTNPETGIYKYKVDKNNKYKIIVRAKNAIGSYKISFKELIKD